jgi:hypothetical protein
MKSFQWIFLILLGAGLAVEFWKYWRDVASRGASTTRIIVWGAAAVAIALPELVQMVANAVGIDRGADLVLYLFVCAFLMAAFYFYAKTVLLQRQITTIVRRQAISDAEYGAQADPSGLRVVHAPPKPVRDASA